MDLPGNQIVVDLVDPWHSDCQRSSRVSFNCEMAIRRGAGSLSGEPAFMRAYVLAARYKPSKNAVSRHEPIQIALIVSSGSYGTKVHACDRIFLPRPR